MATVHKTQTDRPSATRTSRRVPFPVVDEIARHCADPNEPNTIHMEIHLPGKIRPDALRTAFGQALSKHPRVLMRERRHRPFARRYEWELTESPHGDVLRFPPCEPGALAHARRRALDDAPALNSAPPLRLEVIEEPGTGGCVLLFTVHHTALDGPACLRIAATTAELYSGHPASAIPASPLRLPSRPAKRSTSLPRPAARVAAGRPGATPGNALLTAELAIPPREPHARYTVNDQLLVATALTIASWNRRQGAPDRPLRITMPIDDRDRGPAMPIGNGTRLAEITFTPADVQTTTDIGSLLHDTARHTRALKARGHAPLGRGVALLTAPILPVSARAALTRGVRRIMAPWTSTTLLSNFGRIPYPLDFGDAGHADAVWISAPAAMPRGLTFTTASTGGRLHVALRWSRTLLGDEDGAHLLETFTRQLAATETEAR
ncbi:condensation protein [Streptomyces zaomyceticus]|uniref:condensation protein n=1 Tax=Streptomyces zaomyceticus TaxID=68286 RepID=UPI00341E1D49